MSKTPSKPLGAFSWNELMTTDVDAAKAFYSELFDWNIQKCDAADMDYFMATRDGEDIAGLMSMPGDSAGMPPSWGGYVTVADVDAMVPRVAQLGGKIALPPQDIPDVGRFAVIQDPQGAMLSLISYTK